MNVKYNSYVIRRKSDGALVTQGTAEQCAKDLGICLATFYRRRWRKIGGIDAYHVTCKVCHKTVARRSRHMIYTIFRAGTNDVIVTGTAQQCAATLGIQVKSFWTTLANISAGRYHQYDYQREGYYDVE
ncbi:hypothetical protein [Butyricicoccus pullicaecorum]|uniref:Uncharacterized protein n=1 Tax=Butyricicoccus pullicaecorum 1.2 TaxID=1203606 RepID=R8W0R6_9FIRM|nr:hypothetical protein [Butyricicoccus pullicaecorum]EOQ38294.1 hypothetical protein HMPREF1526_01324 [Butyricicoccus pullicaecorum 1.2]SKA54344.1 hypothetical protein SAMN02745978_00529 [Butyricicoccus pullicaecorum DSM 23266]